MASANDALREDVLACFQAGLDAVEPREIVRRALERTPIDAGGRVVLAAVGKASIAMAEGALEVLGDRVVEGVVIAPVPAEGFPARIRTYCGGHPLPNPEGVAGAEDVRALAEALGEGDLLLTLISGGGSALMTLPPNGVTLDDLQVATERLLRAGIDIVELNGVRKHLDDLKGGRLARLAAPADVRGLVLSDVVGDPLDAIASGPATADPTTFVEALGSLERLGVRDELPVSVVAHLELGERGEAEESPKPGDPCFERVSVELVGSNQIAAEASCRAAKARGYDVTLLSTVLTGEARDVGAELASRARGIVGERGPDAGPVCLVAAGETTVTVRGRGRGGRNQELTLGAAIEMAGLEGVVVASIGTDGIDGPTDAAGALAFGDTVDRARGMDLDPTAFLDRNDSYSLFRELGDLVVTGPTGTNVMDLQFVFVI